MNSDIVKFIFKVVILLGDSLDFCLGRYRAYTRTCKHDIRLFSISSEISDGLMQCV